MGNNDTTKRPDDWVGIPGDIVIDREYQTMSKPDFWYVTDLIKELHRRGITGKGSTFSINDTGGTKNHPWLKPPKKIFSHVPGENGIDGNGHGTACASIAMAIAPGAEYFSIQVLNRKGEGSTSWINKAYGTAADNGVDFINGSYGDMGGPDRQEDISKIDAAYDKGVLCVNIAAGNSGFNGRTNTIGRPASYGNTICVGATDRNDKISGFSSGGPQMDVATYGQDMPFATPRGGYSRGNGTSFSCPRFTGVECLTQQVRRQNGFPDLYGNHAWMDFYRDEGLLKDAGPRGHDPSYGDGLPDEVKILQWNLDKTPKWL